MPDPTHQRRGWPPGGESIKIGLGVVIIVASVAVTIFLKRPGSGAASSAPDGSTNNRELVSPENPSKPAVAAPRTVYVDPSSGAFAELVASDPATAASALSQSADLDLHDRWLLDIMDSWLRRAPQESLDWVTALPAGEFKNAATEDLFYTWANVDPATAATSLENQIRSGNPTPGLVPFVNAWALRDPESAAGWLKQLGEDAPPRALAALAGSWVATEPEAATAWLASLDPIQRSLTAPRLAIAWANTDPEAALRWIRSLPDIPEKQAQQATLAALASWAGSESPSAAIGYVEAMPDSPKKTQALQTVAESLADSDPAAAVDLALSIDTPGAQSESLANIYDAWVADDQTGDARLHLAATLATLPPGAPARNALLDVLYHHDPPFREELLRRATQ